MAIEKPSGLPLSLSGSACLTASLATEVREREGKVTACDGGDQRSPAVQSWAGSSGEGEGRTAELKWLEWKWRTVGGSVERTTAAAAPLNPMNVSRLERAEQSTQQNRPSCAAAATTFNMNRAKEEAEAEEGSLANRFLRRGEHMHLFAGEEERKEGLRRAPQCAAPLLCAESPPPPPSSPKHPPRPSGFLCIVCPLFMSVSWFRRRRLTMRSLARGRSRAEEGRGRGGGGG